MSLTKLAQRLIREKFYSVECGIDATCGNGIDTLFLAGICEKNGKILSFDIQIEALDKAKILLKDNNLNQKVSFINSGHENMEQFITQNADLIMFNLGFLPNSESRICTKPDTTIIALDSATKLIRAGGLFTILCYPGTDEGKLETKQVQSWLDDLNKDDFEFSEYLSENPNDSTPVLFIIEKLC